MTTLEMHDVPKLKYSALSGLSGPRWPVVTGDVRAESGEARPRAPPASNGRNAVSPRGGERKISLSGARDGHGGFNYIYPH